MFVERLGSYQCDIFARTAALAVGVGPCFYGFSMEKQLFWPTVAWPELGLLLFKSNILLITHYFSRKYALQLHITSITKVTSDILLYLLFF